LLAGPLRVSEVRLRRVRTALHYELAGTRTAHRELLGERTGFGVCFRLLAPKSRKPSTILAFSSDTALVSEPPGPGLEELAKAWSEADLLVLHVGSMEDPRKKEPTGEHLGFRGVVDVLKKLADIEAAKPRRARKNAEHQMVVLSEWGYEFGRLGMFGRTRFCQLVQEQLEVKGCDRYYSITERDPIEGRVPIVPADLMLRVSLPNLGIWVEDNNRKEYLPAIQVRAVEDGEYIRYQSR